MEVLERFLFLKNYMVYLKLAILHKGSLKSNALCLGVASVVYSSRSLPLAEKGMNEAVEGDVNS